MPPPHSVDWPFRNRLAVEDGSESSATGPPAHLALRFNNRTRWDGAEFRRAGTVEPEFLKHHVRYTGGGFQRGCPARSALKNCLVEEPLGCRHAE